MRACESMEPNHTCLVITSWIMVGAGYLALASNITKLINFLNCILFSIWIPQNQYSYYNIPSIIHQFFFFKGGYQSLSLVYMQNSNSNNNQIVDSYDHSQSKPLILDHYIFS